MWFLQPKYAEQGVSDAWQKAQKWYLSLGGKNLKKNKNKNKLKSTPKKPQQKNLKQQKNRTERLPEDNQRGNGNQETGNHHLDNIQSAIDGLRIWFCFCMLAKACLLLMGF